MAMGTVITRTLNSGESLLVDTESILCFEDSVRVEIETVGSFAACCCAGENLFFTKLIGE